MAAAFFFLKGGRHFYLRFLQTLIFLGGEANILFDLQKEERNFLAFYRLKENSPFGWKHRGLMIWRWLRKPPAGSEKQPQTLCWQKLVFVLFLQNHSTKKSVPGYKRKEKMIKEAGTCCSQCRWIQNILNKRLF